MSTCTPTPDTPSQIRRSSLTGTDRTTQAQALRATLDAAADLINAQHAQVLSTVIAMKEQNLHRSAFGFSALRDLLVSQFDFHNRTAADIAAIARLSGKFRLLTAAAVSGTARIDQVAYAVRQLDQTPAMRLFARTPFRAPVPSPFDPQVECVTPEAMVAQHCAHASFADLKRHLEELWAAIAEETELLDALGEQSLQRLELTETGNGMWHLEADLTETTGRLLDKYLQTACPPPRQDEQDTDGVLPAQANRHAEALHQLLAGYGSSPEAATRHGHTATLDLVVDIETLQGKDTGRTPLLEGKPISVAQARLLACETKTIPAVFDYETGEAVELGRALRLPNVALRRKLELEQPGGCAWTGCDRPVAWTEAHHITHWADGGSTKAENLILICRFHHGRLHTAGWSVEKTGPGQAVITHHDHESAPEDTTGCGCSDWRTDADMDAEHAGADWDVFPTGLYRTEWSEMLKPDLDGHAEMIERHRALAAIRAARAKARARFTTNSADRSDHSGQAPATTPAPPVAEAPSSREPALAGTARTVAPVGPVDYGEPPFLGGPSRRLLGEARPTTPPTATPPEPHHGVGLLTMPTAGSRHASPTPAHPLVAARPDPNHRPPQGRRNRPRSDHSFVAARSDPDSRDQAPATPPQDPPTPSSPPALTARHHHPEAEIPTPCTITPLSPPALTPTPATGHPLPLPAPPSTSSLPPQGSPPGGSRTGRGRSDLFIAARPNPKRQRPGGRRTGLRT